VRADLGGVARRWLLRAIWFALGSGLIAVAAPLMISGLATESAFPVPIYLSMNVRIPARTCRAASQRLTRTNPHDGDSKIAQADADICSGAANAATMSVLKQGLSLSPASARGWMLYAEQNSRTNPARAAQALTMSFELDEFGYWLVDRRIRDAASLWSVMSTAGKNDTFTQVKLLWQTPDLRPRIEPLLAENGVAAIFSQAYLGDPETLRAINRWRAELIRQRSL
jgi:hypothetical protein